MSKSCSGFSLDSSRTSVHWKSDQDKRTFNVISHKCSRSMSIQSKSSESTFISDAEGYASSSCRSSVTEKVDDEDNVTDESSIFSAGREKSEDHSSLESDFDSIDRSDDSSTGFSTQNSSESVQEITFNTSLKSISFNKSRSGSTYDSSCDSSSTERMFTDEKSSGDSTSNTEIPGERQLIGSKYKCSGGVSVTNSSRSSSTGTDYTRKTSSFGASDSNDEVCKKNERRAAEIHTLVDVFVHSSSNHIPSKIINVDTSKQGGTNNSGHEIPSSECRGRALTIEGDTTVNIVTKSLFQSVSSSAPEQNCDDNTEGIGSSDADSESHSEKSVGTDMALRGFGMTRASVETTEGVGAIGGDAMAEDATHTLDHSASSSISVKTCEELNNADYISPSGESTGIGEPVEGFEMTIEESTNAVNIASPQILHRHDSDISKALKNVMSKEDIIQEIIFESKPDYKPSDSAISSERKISCNTQVKNVEHIQNKILSNLSNIENSPSHSNLNERVVSSSSYTSLFGTEGACIDKRSSFVDNRSIEMIPNYVLEKYKHTLVKSSRDIVLKHISEPKAIKSDDTSAKREDEIFVDEEVGAETNMDEEKDSSICQENTEDESESKWHNIRDKWGSCSKYDLAANFFYLVSFFIILYFFLFSIVLLGTSAQVIGGCYFNSYLRRKLNPVSSVMLGALVSAIVQSYTVSYSIISALVGSTIDVKQGIYMSMGLNFGSSITSKIVATGHIGSAKNMQRAFEGAVVNDVFYLLATSVILPLEVVSHYLHHFSSVQLVDEAGVKSKWTGILDIIINPLQNIMIIFNLDLVKENLSGEEGSCESNYPVICKGDIESFETCASGIIGCDKKTGNCPAFFKGASTQQVDEFYGIVSLVIALALLFVSFIGIVTILKKVTKATKEKLLFKMTKSSGCRNDYLAMLVGCIFTMLVGDSSATISTFIPFVGTGFIETTQIYPLSLGANIGASITICIIAATSGNKDYFHVALANLFFNISGFLLWYLIPRLRTLPVNMASYLGRASQKMKIFPIIYIAFTFILLPLNFILLNSAFQSDNKISVALGIIWTVVLGIVLFYAIYWWNFRSGKERFLSSASGEIEVEEDEFRMTGGEDFSDRGDNCPEFYFVVDHQKD